MKRAAFLLMVLAAVSLSSSVFADITFIHTGTLDSTYIGNFNLYDGLTNFLNNTNGVIDTGFTGYSRYDDIFTPDGQTWYRTNSSGEASPSVSTYNSFSDLVNHTNYTTQSFAISWAGDDEFFSDGTYFYRTNTGGDLHQSVTRYDTLNDLITSTSGTDKGTLFNFSTFFLDTDEFFSDGTNYYRTNTDAGGTYGLAVYPTFGDLVANTNATTYDFYSGGSTIDWASGDQFLAIPVPEPTTMSLLGLGAAALLRKRRRK